MTDDSANEVINQMNKTGKPIKIVVRGTDRSRLLDRNEEKIVEYQPGASFEKGINTVADLFQSAVFNAMTDGDQLVVFIVSDRDLVTLLIRSELLANHLNADKTADELKREAVFSNYDQVELRERINEILSFEIDKGA